MRNMRFPVDAYFYSPTFGFGMAESASHTAARTVLVLGERLAEKLALSTRVRDAGFEVQPASGVEDGLAASRRIHPAVAVCADRLPDGGGVDFCREIKADPDLRSIHLLVVAGRAASREIVHALEAGADDLVRGPLDLDVLIAKVRAGLRNHAIREQMRCEQYRSVLLQMAATLGHRINNPLTGILGHLELVRMYLGRGETPRVEHHLEEAGRGIHRIGDVSYRLMVLADPKVTTYLGQTLMLDLDAHDRGDGGV